MKEHQACVRKGDSDKSALAEHTESTGHAIHWCETEILQSESRIRKTKEGGAKHVSLPKRNMFFSIETVGENSLVIIYGTIMAILNTK